MNTIMSQKSANIKADLFHFGTIYKVKFMRKKNPVDSLTAI